MNQELLETALTYRAAGLSVIVVQENKQSLGEWSRFQLEIASEEALRSSLADRRAVGIAAVCGSISGGLEVLDVDAKYDLTDTLFSGLTKMLRQAGLLDQLVITRTRSGGYHLIFRSDHCQGNRLLARRPATDTERASDPHVRVKVLIETRGEGGYFLIPPTPGYQFLQHDMLNIPRLTEVQRNELFGIARRFNLYQEPERVIPQTFTPRRNGELTPLDDFDRRGDVLELLQRHGWLIVGQKGPRTLLRRPGETDKFSSGDYNHELQRFCVFSTSTEFIRGRGYKPYAVFTVLECNGDYAEAVRRLAAAGYGTKSPNRRWRRRAL